MHAPQTPHTQSESTQSPEHQQHTSAGADEKPYISDFIKLIMPEASERDQLDAQRDLDGYLDIIDEIEERLFREDCAACDKTAKRDSSTDMSTNEGETRNAP